MSHTGKKNNKKYSDVNRSVRLSVFYKTCSNTNHTQLLCSSLKLSMLLKLDGTRTITLACTSVELFPLNSSYLHILSRATSDHHLRCGMVAKFSI